MSKKLLMHCNDKVLSYTENTKGYVESVTAVYNDLLLPFHCNNPKNYPFKLQQWLLESRASLNREDINTLAAFYGKDYISPPNFVSLLNNYWIKSEKDIYLTWDRVNPYDNWRQEEDIIDILIHSPNMLETNPPIIFNSPNMTLPGYKERYWYKEGNQFYIIERKAKKSQLPIIIYEQELFTKKKIPFINKEFELMPFTFYLDSIDDPNITTDLLRIQTAAEIYQLDKSQIHMNHLSDTYVARDATSLSVIDVIVL